jgi:hypothetical protein
MKEWNKKDKCGEMRKEDREERERKRAGKKYPLLSSSSGKRRLKIDKSFLIVYPRPMMSWNDHGQFSTMNTQRRMSLPPCKVTTVLQNQKEGSNKVFY